MYEYKKGFAISVKVPEELYDAVTNACQQSGQKRSELVRAALEAELGRIATAHHNTTGLLAVEKLVGGTTYQQHGKTRTYAPATQSKRARLARQLHREGALK